MKIVCELHISKALVLFLWMRFSYTHFSRKNPATKHKTVLFFNGRYFSPLSQCAALSQASDFWQNFSHVKNMELKKTKYAWFVRFQSLRLESRLESWLVTCRWLTLWNPDKMFWQIQEEAKDGFKDLYCLEVLLVLLLYRSQMKCVMWCLLVKGVRGWHWEGSWDIEAGLEKTRRSQEHGAVERLSRDLAGQVVKRSGV